MEKILYVTTSFYPETKISAIRNSKISKYLAKKGFQVTVLSPNFENDDVEIKYYDFDEKLINIRVPHTKVYSSTFLKSRNKYINRKYQQNNNKNESKNNTPKKYNGRVQEVFTLVQAHDWKRSVISVINKNLKGQKYDYVITSYPRLSSLLIGEYILKNKIASKWVADFRDPMFYQTLHSKWYSKIHEKYQVKYGNMANLITHVSEGMKTSLSKDVNDKSKFNYLPNGYDKDDLKLIAKSSVNLKENYNNNFIISYVGSMYGGKRDLSIIFEILNNLSVNNSIDMNKIKFAYAGKEFNVVEKQAKQFGMESILVNFGLVTKADSLAIQQQSDLVCVATWNTEVDKGVIPGKIYECFLLQKPTLAIINGTTPDGELGNMVEKSGLGIKFETMIDNDKQKNRLQKFILDINNSSGTKNHFGNKSLDINYILQFDYENITERLLELVKNLE